MNLRNWIALCRPHQWLKNSFVFAGLIFAHAWHDFYLVSQVILATLAFCLTASSAYIINDLIDQESDRQHVLKKDRPLARADVSKKSAIGCAVLCSILGLAAGFSVSFLNGSLLLIYLALTVTYSIWLKYIVIIDVMTISAGFILRILAGTSGVGILPSLWLLLCSMFLTLFLALTKRHAEYFFLTLQQIPLTRHLKNYSAALLQQLMSITATGTIISYALYALYQDHYFYADQARFIYTTPLVIFGIFRYLAWIYQHTDNAAGSDLAKDFFANYWLLGVAIIWLISVITLGIYHH